MSARTVRRSAACWAALAPLIALVLFPYAVMLSTALKTTPEVMSFPPHWIPRAPSLASFPAMWVQARLGTAIGNSLGIAACSVLLTLAAAVPAAYALARLRFRARPLYRLFLLVTQMLAPVLLIIGLFRMAAAVPFGGGTLVNTRLGVVLIYAAFQLAFSVWMLSAYFAAIPQDIEEAAWIDGCGRLQAVRHVFLPLAVPAVAVCALVAFVAGWNEYIVALTMLRDPDKQTVTLQVVNLVAGRYSVAWNQVMAGALVATLPVAVVFAALQRYLVRGLAMGAVK
ncbi:MAG: carbohydrate ABC transporter permease [Acidisphaera sp.]|nr:carbohydrate ABC transporter permease [Acidisphaera sp.]MBV9812752.1 carbohydrate ABC transporter permease [Acetobacteraceae bacterium]